jgi:hypothetical protein
MGPASYLMTDPFWFTQRGSGLWVKTNDVMDVAMNGAQEGDLRLYADHQQRHGLHGLRRARRP